MGFTGPLSVRIMYFKRFSVLMYGEMIGIGQEPIPESVKT